MSTVHAPALPLRELGWLANNPPFEAPYFPAMVHAPQIPLHQLGWLADGTALLKQGGAAGSAIAESVVTSAAANAGWGAWAGPVGAAAAVAIGVIVSLIAAHEQRVKDAKNENAAAAQAVSGFYSVMQQIVQAYNSGQLSQSDAIAQLHSLDQSTYQALRSHVGPPGTAWSASGQGCNKSCTVGCCVYNSFLSPDINGSRYTNQIGLIAAMQTGRPSVRVAGLASNKYGFPAMPYITLTLNPPAGAGAVLSQVESMFGGQGGSILPLLLIAGAAFLVLK